MDKEAQHANQDIRYVVEKGHIQDDRSVPSGERATISDKTHQKYYFITKLKGGKDSILLSYLFWNSQKQQVIDKIYYSQSLWFSFMISHFVIFQHCLQICM